MGADSNLKKVTLELGGKSPNIVFNDADIEQAISWVNFGIYFNHGQCCCAGTRIFVQEGIYDKFLEAFKKRSLQNKVGDPFESDTFQGPQVSQLQYDRIMGYIGLARRRVPPSRPVVSATATRATSSSPPSSATSPPT